MTRKCVIDGREYNKIKQDMQGKNNYPDELLQEDIDMLNKIVLIDTPRYLLASVIL